jgi:hypothetical protein
MNRVPSDIMSARGHELLDRQAAFELVLQGLRRVRWQIEAHGLVEAKRHLIENTIIPNRAHLASDGEACSPHLTSRCELEG